MTFRAVLFDLDGTLLDTLQDLADAMNGALADLGHPPHPVGAYRYFVGNGAVNLARRTLPEAARTEEQVARAVAAFSTRYAENWNATTHPYPGVMALLMALHERGLTLAILTNKPDAFAQQTVQALLPAQLFAAVVGMTPQRQTKPDPSEALRLARELGIPPAEWLYLGDTATDMETARAAGMYPVGALWGFRTADELCDSGAQVLAAQPADLLQVLDA